MKKYMCLIGLIILVSSCGDTKTITIPKTEYDQLKGVPAPIIPEYPKLINFNDGNGWECKSSIIIIDSCEYISKGFGTDHGLLLHKGNCKFCQQRLEQTIRKIIQEELQKK
jgi:hypothetical protein